MELNTGDTRYVSGENSYAQWYEPITVFKLGLAAFNICYKFSPHYIFLCILIVTYLFRENCYAMPIRSVTANNDSVKNFNQSELRLRAYVRGSA